MTFASRLVAAVVAVAALSACTEGRGPVQVQTRDLPEFSAVDMQGAAALQINIASPASVTIEGNAQVLDRIETEVREGTLYIRSRAKNWMPSADGRHVAVRINLPKLASLRLDGGYRASIDGFAGGKSEIRVEGAAKLDASGHLDELIVHLAGAGTANLSNLKSANTHVTVDGVGRVVVHSTETLDATMNGMGAIHYLGNPREVRTRMNGLGSIGRQDTPELKADEESKPELNPENLQPEYDASDKWKKGGETEVL